jgi:hypothetical protein
VSMEEFSQVLWRERELLEMLAFKLEEEELVLAHGRSRWLAFASREVETVLDMVQRTEVLRAATADAVAAATGLDSNPSLRALVESSDEPWRTILLDHRDGLVALTLQVTETAAASRELLAAGYQSTRAKMTIRSDAAGICSSDGSADGTGSGRSTAGADVSGPYSALDESLHRRRAARAHAGAHRATATVDLRLQEVAYRAALATSARVLQPTLLEFLR